MDGELRLHDVVSGANELQGVGLMNYKGRG